MNKEVDKLRYCARCGGDHEHIVFEELELPIAPDDVPIRWTHWAKCPANGEPILMRAETE